MSTRKKSELRARRTAHHSRDLGAPSSAALALAESEALRGLEDDWARAIDSQKEGLSQEVAGAYFNLGLRSGEMMIDWRPLIAALQKRLEMLLKGEVNKQRTQLAELDMKLNDSLRQRLPDLAQRREQLRERGIQPITRPAGRSAWIWLLEVLLFACFAGFPLASEFVLADQVTELALLIDNAWLFALALVATTAVFKLGADEIFKDSSQYPGAGEKSIDTRKKIQWGCMVVMILLWISLLVPVTHLRTGFVIEKYQKGGKGRKLGEVESASKAQPGANSAGAKVQNPRDDPRYVNLYMTFFLAGVLFPMVSGICLSRLLVILEFFFSRAFWRRHSKLTIRELEEIAIAFDGQIKIVVHAARQRVFLLHALGAGTQEEVRKAILEIHTAASQALGSEAFMLESTIRKIIGNPERGEVSREHLEQVHLEATGLLRDRHFPDHHRLIMMYSLGVLAATLEPNHPKPLQEIRDALADHLAQRIRIGHQAGMSSVIGRCDSQPKQSGWWSQLFVQHKQ